MKLKVLTCAESSLSSMLSQLSVICIICILFSLFCPILAFQLPQSIIIQLMLGMWLQPSTLHTYHHSQHQQRQSLCSSHIRWGGKNYSPLSVVCQRRSKLGESARWVLGYSQCQCWWEEERVRIEGEWETERGGGSEEEKLWGGLVLIMRVVWRDDCYLSLQRGVWPAYKPPMSFKVISFRSASGELRAWYATFPYSHSN